MSVCAVIEIEERKLEIVRTQRKDIALILNHDLRIVEISNLSLSLQLAYLGVMIRYAKRIDGIMHKMNELVAMFGDLASACSEMIKLVRIVTKSLQRQCQDTAGHFDLDKHSIMKVRDAFAACLHKADVIRSLLCRESPNPIVEMHKIYKKVKFSLRKVLFRSSEDFCISSYSKQAEVSMQLFQVMGLQYASVTLAALGSFHVGIKHILKTIDSFLALSQTSDGKIALPDPSSIQREVSLVVMATATAAYFETIAISITEIEIFLHDKYRNERATEMFQQMMMLFLKSIHEQKKKKEKGAVCSVGSLNDFSKFAFDMFSLSDFEADDESDDNEDAKCSSDSSSESDSEKIVKKTVEYVKVEKTEMILDKDAIKESLVVEDVVDSGMIKEDGFIFEQSEVTIQSNVN